MTGVELIVAALAAGAAAGLTEATSGAIRDAYVGLRDAVRRRLAGSGADTQDEQILDALEEDPGVWRARLGKALVDAGVDRDEQVLDAAKALLDRLEPSAGKYTVDAREAQGVVIGDHATQTNTFS
jgi:hypothetical protein